MPFHRAILPLILFGALTSGAAAQYRPPFSTVTFHGAVQENVGQSLLHDYWSASRGGEFVISTPLHLGEGEVGAMANKWTPTSTEVPAFNSVIAFAGWSAVFEPIQYVHLQAGVRIGAHRMSFDVETFEGAQDETEVALGAQARLRIAPVPWAGVYVGATYLQTYTYVRMRLTYVSVGIHSTLKSPTWLRTFLR